MIFDLYEALNTNAGVRAYVGLATSPQTSKVYPNGDVSEDATLPFIAYFETGREHLHTIEGIDNMSRPQYDISCYSQKFNEASAMADAVHDALEGNGYEQVRVSTYDPQMKAHSFHIVWSFLDP